MTKNLRHLDILPLALKVIDNEHKFVGNIYSIKLDFIKIKLRIYKASKHRFILSKYINVYIHNFAKGIFFQGDIIAEVFFSGDMRGVFDLFYTLDWDWDEQIIIQ